jgi:hypothetical protein
VRKRIVSLSLIGAALLATALLAAAASGQQCTIDPLTGQQQCTASIDGWRLAQLPEREGVLGVVESPAPLARSLAHVRIVASDGVSGSGTLILRNEKFGLVLTCSHLFDGTPGRVVIEFADGQRFDGRLVERDTVHDLAALLIRRPSIEPIALDRDDPDGVLSSCGYGPEGAFRTIQGSVVGSAMGKGASFASVVISGEVRPGDSGGAVLNAAGRLVGVVWGKVNGETYAMCGKPVREFVKRIWDRAVASKTSPATLPGEPALPGGPVRESHRPNFDLQAWISEIESRIKALDEKKQDKGEYALRSELDAYVRVEKLPKLDADQFARQAEVEQKFESLSAWVESVRKRIEQLAANKSGFFDGLSVGKLIAGALSLSGPVAVAVIVAGGLARRRLKSRVKSQVADSPGRKSRAGGDLALDARHSALDSRPIAVDSPPQPQRTVPETHYVSIETDSFAKAHQWASEQVARKYPGATEVLQAQNSLIKQHLAAQ